MSDFRFANPSWVHAIWLVIGLVTLLLWLDGRGRAVLDRFLSPAMQQRLAWRISRRRRWAGILLLGLSLAALVGALMRPQWGLTYFKTPRVGAQLMVCLDVSKSMLAEDTAPNRLDRAKAELVDLLSYLEGDQIGLIAFAGKAAVLCPMTTDYGFFKLVLDNAGPHSVGRGGTRLEAPLRKAMDGFRTESDVSRAILLVTDGEDHDSYPLKAAQEAAERGIKVIAIGFGDEAGSEIHYTDPDTGARTVVRDADGNPVRSRLDGETLRQIAMATEGAYVPAGTGALDLESIYRVHLAPLTRGRLDQRGHAVRREGFQWAVLLALSLLLASLAATSGSASRAHAAPAGGALSARSGRRRAAGTAASAMLLAAAAAVGGPAAPIAAQQQAAGSRSSDAAQTTNADQPPEASKGQPPKSEKPAAASQEPTEPRTAYNQAVACLDTDLDRAERLLSTARREAGTDAEVRFRATFNMGWVEIKRADALLKDDPAQALVHLRAAADQFRDAVRLRSEDRDARQNLEIVLRRIMALADALRKDQQQTVVQRLDALIASQRRLVGETGGLVQRLAAEADPNAPDQFRAEFHAQAVDQRKNLSDAQSLAKTVQEELDTLKSAKDQDQKPADRMRAAQLTAVLDHVHPALQRMGQARSQMRRRQAERAFRRAAAALDDLKRARDQLRDPVELLGVILADAVQTAAQTAALASESGLPNPNTPARPAPPAWLSADYLDQSQTVVADRAEELADGLEAALAQHKQTSAKAEPGPTPQDARRERMLRALREATPLVRQGADAAGAARDRIRASKLVDANQQQFASIAALQQARERFLDVRGLIELTYSVETRLQTLLAAPTDATDAGPDEIAAAGLPLQRENLQRAERLANLIDQELAALPAADANATPPASSGGPAKANPAQDAQQAAAQRQRFELASRLIQQAQAAMADAEAELQKGPQPAEADAVSQPKEKDQTESAAEDQPDAPPPAPLGRARAKVHQAVELLGTLRRLFFSIVEHLRETVQRQATLNDDTQRVATLSEPDRIVAELQPLGQRQQELATIGDQIGKALKQQAQEAKTGAGTQAADQQQAEQLKKHMQQIAGQFDEAGKLVADGAAAMHRAASRMREQAPDVKDVRSDQDKAIEKLAQALALLVPPEQRPQEPRRQDQEQSQKEQGKQDKDKQEGANNLARLMQAVRDREAQRKKDQKQRRIDYEPVDKDW